MSRQRAGAVGQYFEGAINDPGRVLVGEVHSSTCAHCSAMTEFPSQKTMLEYVDICRGCMRLICLPCVGKPCDPVEAKLERQELEARLRREGYRCF